MYNDLSPRHALLAGAILAALAAPAVAAVPIVVNDTTCKLSDAIVAANTDATFNGCAAGSGDDTIEITADIALTAELPSVATNIQFTTDGPKRTITGDGAHRLFMIYGNTAPAVGFNNLILSGGAATGGSATNGAGAGAGLGGAMFIVDGNVNITATTFDNNSATGGNTSGTTGFTGNPGTSIGRGGDGGAGMYGAGGGGAYCSSITGCHSYAGTGGSGGGFGGGGGGGGTSDGEFGGGGGNGGGGSSGGFGGAGAHAGVPNIASTAGGLGEFGGGGGGGGGGWSSYASQPGGSGGFGGGGGGGAGSCNYGACPNPAANGGPGGFGGGGGAGGSNPNTLGLGGAGGFGGGGGTNGRGEGGSGAGFGGFGGGNAVINSGTTGGGGGGAGFGGAIFIRSGSLDVRNSRFEGNSAVHGTGSGNPGLGKGAAIFAIDSTANTNGNNLGMPASVPVVIGCNDTFASNTSDDAGSAMLDNSATYGANYFTLTDCIFTDDFD